MCDCTRRLRRHHFIYFAKIFGPLPRGPQWNGETEKRSFYAQETELIRWRRRIHRRHLLLSEFLGDKKWLLESQARQFVWSIGNVCAAFDLGAWAAIAQKMQRRASICSYFSRLGKITWVTMHACSESCAYKHVCLRSTIKHCHTRILFKCVEYVSSLARQMVKFHR